MADVLQQQKYSHFLRLNRIIFQFPVKTSIKKKVDRARRYHDINYQVRKIIFYSQNKIIYETY